MAISDRETLEFIAEGKNAALVGEELNAGNRRVAWILNHLQLDTAKHLLAINLYGRSTKVIPEPTWADSRPIAA